MQERMYHNCLKSCKKILSVLLALLLFSTSVYGAETDVDRDKSLISITGTAEPNAVITIIAVREDDTLDGITDAESFNASVNFIGQKRALPDGSFTFLFKTKNPDDVAEYHLLVNETGVPAEVVNYDVFYFNSNASETLATEVIGYTEDKKVFAFVESKQAAVLDLNMLFYSQLTEAEKMTVCKAVADMTEGNADKVREVFFESSMIQTVNKTEKMTELDAFLSLLELHGLTEAVCGLASDSEWYAKLGKNAEKYKSRIIKNIPYADAEDFYQEYRLSVALACVEFLKNTFTKSIIQDFNDVLDVDLDLVKESKETKVFTALAGQKYTDAADFRNAFAEAVSDAGGSSGGGGGSDSGRKDYGGGFSGGGQTGPITVVDEEMAPNPAETTKNMPKDMTESHYAYEAVQSLTAKGIISGYPDGNFYPDKEITRAEFVKLLVNLTGIKSPEGENVRQFDDVDSNQWYDEYIRAGVAAGLVNGISETEFGPELPITRQDAAVMVHRAAAYMGISFDGAQVVSFNDFDTVSEYAQESVRILSSAGVINGMDGSFAPKQTANRGQCAKIIHFIEIAKGE